MKAYNEELTKTLNQLKGSWKVQNFQLAGMGWAAQIVKESHLFTLHSERGWIDIFIGNYKDQNKIGCTKSMEKVAKIINEKTL